MILKGPQLCNSFFEAKSNTISEPVTRNGAESRSDPNWPKSNVSCRYEAANSEEDSGRWNKQRDECERFAERQQKYDGYAPLLMLLHEPYR